MTEEEYLRVERAAEGRSEFVNGEAREVTGASPGHSMLAGGVLSELVGQLRGKGCAVMNCLMRMRVPAGSYLYADLVVVRGPVKLYGDSDDVLVNPILLAEVMSPATADYDRGAKFEMYRTIPTLREYVAIHQDSVFVEHWARNEDASWTLREYRGEEARVPLSSIECELHLGSLYEGILEEPV